MNIVLAILALSIMIIVHEFGHFIVAKANGVRVKEFSIGLGPRLCGIRTKETDYCLKLLPFGGACVMQGDVDDETSDEKQDETRSFENKSVWARISIIAAGPIFNFLLAFVFAVIIIGRLGYSPAKVYSVEEDSIAYEAGIREGDVITKINGRTISFDTEYSTYRLVYPEKTMNITYVRDGKKYKTTLVPNKVTKTAYRVGITIQGEPVTIAEVSDGPAKDAGIKVNDVIKKINGKEVKNTSDVGTFMSEKEGAECTFTLLRDGNTVEVKVTPILTEYEEVETGMVVYSQYVKGNAWTTLKYSASQVRYSIATVFDSFHMLFAGQVTSKDIAGPVGIVNVISNTVESSKEDGTLYVILNLLYLIVLLSANLGVMNLLPIPALDGGRLVFLLIEAVRGKPIAREKEGMVHFVGMALLMVLMVIIMFNDIRNVFFS